MKTVWQVVFGLSMGAAGVVVSVYLGLLLRGQPDWRTGVGAFVLLAVTQWVAFFAFRYRIALQVLFGVIFCMAIGVWLLYSGIPMFWEHEDSQPNVYPITWRSDLMFLLLLAATQGVSFLIFHRLRRVAQAGGAEIDGRR